MDKVDTIIALRDGQLIYERIVEFILRLLRLAQQYHPQPLGSLKEDVFELLDAHNTYDKLVDLRDHPKKTELMEKDLESLFTEFFNCTDNDTDIAERDRK